MDTKTEATAQEFLQSLTALSELTLAENEPIRAGTEVVLSPSEFSEVYVRQEEKRRSFLSRKKVLFDLLLLAFCVSFAFKFKRAREAATGLVKGEEEREKAEPENFFLKEKPQTLTTDQITSALPPVPAVAESLPATYATSGRAAENVTDEDQLKFNQETLLGFTAPVFFRPSKDFESPKTAAERWANKAAESMQLLKEEADEETAEEFKEFVIKELPRERDLPVFTDTLRTLILEIRKQQFVRTAVDCFKWRRRREEAYATMRLMEQYLQIIKDNENQENQPTHLTNAMKTFETSDKNIVMEKEEAVLAEANMVYEHSLVRERVSLEELHGCLLELSGHVASMEIFQKMDASTSEWKTKVPQLKDFGQAMNDLENTFTTDIFGQVPGIAADLQAAKATVFGNPNAAFMALAKLADIVNGRKAINRKFWVLHDPRTENLTDPMVCSARSDVFQMMDKVEKLKKETGEYLKTRGEDIKVEWWLALIL